MVVHIYRLMVVVGLVARLRIVRVLWFYLFIFFVSLWPHLAIFSFLGKLRLGKQFLFSMYFELPNMVFVKKIVFENRKYLLNNQDSREKVYHSMGQKRLVQGELMQDPTIVVFRLIALIVESLFESSSCPR